MSHSWAPDPRFAADAAGLQYWTCSKCKRCLWDRESPDPDILIDEEGFLVASEAASCENLQVSDVQDS